MANTSLSLLESLRVSTDSDSWNRLVSLYAPLVRVWLRKYEVQDCDADDLVQDVLLAVSLTVHEKSELDKAGAIRGVVYSMDITGDPQNVAATVQSLVCETFSIEPTSVCDYVYRNLPPNRQP